MRKFWLTGLLVAVVSSALVIGSSATTTVISGDYVEARTASVFAGACHFNGEVVTTGRDAVMAWNVKSGKWQGTDLAGARAVAIVSADANLIEADAPRHSEIVVDSAASDAQAEALVEALKAKYAATLGKVVAVRRAPVSFEHEARGYAVKAANFATLSVSAMPNDECCRMPNLVWYSPLAPLSNRKVGFTAKATYAGGAVGESWQREGENSAFYGSFSF